MTAWSGIGLLYSCGKHMKLCNECRLLFLSGDSHRSVMSPESRHNRWDETMVGL